jgi:4-hydroxybenzoate polyprenyltransferase
MTPRKPSVAFAFVDLTRMLYFGPAVASVFLLGALLAMPDVPMWSALVRMLAVGVLGFSGGFVLNDWADWKADRTMLAARAHDADYLAQLRRERVFTHTRPVAAGIVSLNAALAFALALIGASAAVAFTFPFPQRFYVLGALAFDTVAEPTYCFIKRRQGTFPFATFFHAILEGLCPAAAYLAIRRPDLTALGLFACIYFWEVGFNQVYDALDVENDRLRGLTTLSTTVGVRFVAGWGLTFSLLTTAAFVWTWRLSHSGPVMLAGVLAGGMLMAGADVLLLLRPRPAVAKRTVGIHLAQLILVVGATAVDVVLRWTGVY